MAAAVPNFRADHIGSLLRPAAITAARKRHFADSAEFAEHLREVEDAEIPSLIQMQADAGLRMVTDGAARQDDQQDGILAGLIGLERKKPRAQKGATTTVAQAALNDILDFPLDHPLIGHFTFVAEHTDLSSKIAIPGPFGCHFLVRPVDIHVPEYRDPQFLFDDIARTYAKAVQAFYDAGCRYLQMDDIYISKLCESAQRVTKKTEGQDPDWLIDRYVAVIDQATKDRPDDMVIALHLDRGAVKLTETDAGATDRATDALFNKTGIDVFFMEFDDDNDAGLERLSMLPKGRQRVMPGFISATTGILERRDALQRKFDAAGRFCDLDQMGIAPNRGFAAPETGTAISYDDQRRKLDLVVATAEAIWGEV